MTKGAGAGHQWTGPWAAGPEDSCLNPDPVENSERERDAEGLASLSASCAARHPSVPFDEVYERYFEFVWRSLRMLGVGQASLDDAVQDVFGTVSRQLHRFEGRSSLRTWVFGITQYTAANHRRTARRKSAPLAVLDDSLVSGDPSPHAHAEARQLAAVIFDFCEELDEERRAVFVLSLLEEVPASEVAELLEIPVNTVYSRARALKVALRQRLEQREPGLVPGNRRRDRRPEVEQ